MRRGVVVATTTSMMYVVPRAFVTRPGRSVDSWNFLSRVTSIRFFFRRSAKLCRIALCLLVDRTSPSLQLLVMCEAFSTPSPHLRHVLLVALIQMQIEYEFQKLFKSRTITVDADCNQSIDGSMEEYSPATWVIRVRFPVDAEQYGFWFWMVLIYLHLVHFSS